MKVLSLFDGISCVRVALDRAGIPVDAYYASEIDKYATQISQKNYPNIIRLGDVQSIRNSSIDILSGGDMQYMTKIDLLIGGSPCQDLSIAKQGRKGLDGERSGLFWEYVRILHEVKPKYFVLENVASMPKEAKDIITKTLGVQPIMIDAALVSAQRRKRLFWTNIPNVTLPEDRGILLRDILLEDGVIVQTPRGKNKGGTHTEKSPTVTSNSFEHNNKVKPVPQSQRIYSIDGKSVTLSANGGGGGAKTGLYRIPNKSRTIHTSGRGSGFGDKHNWDMISEERMLMPVECERLQSLPDGYTDGVSNTQRYKMLGNAFNVDVVAHILKHIP